MYIGNRNISTTYILEEIYIHIYVCVYTYIHQIYVAVAKVFQLSTPPPPSSCPDFPRTLRASLRHFAFPTALEFMNVVYLPTKLQLAGKGCVSHKVF